jgi:NAD(P)-dependent dehydrogenase (short-subunit alcohol dehydrogenase family)
VVRLDGKVAVVTGAGQGIGRAIAEAMAEAGASVVLAARDRERLDATAERIRQAGGTALAVPTDVGDPGQVETLAETTQQKLGVPDVLVANSGIPGPTAELWRVTPDEWEQTLRVNLTGVYLTARVFLPAMIARASGAIVAIGSITGKRPLHGRSPYAASKLGLVGLVRTLATETGPHGIRANLVSPGAVAGPRLDAVIAAQATERGTSPDEVAAELQTASPLGRLVTPDDIANVAVFLASDAAASITGQDINAATGQVMY